MSYAYSNCYNLTGNPVCGNKVTDMTQTYFSCYTLTGSPVCGDNVTTMSYTYGCCNNLTGSPVCGLNVTDMSYTYYNCTNLYGDMYMLSNSVKNIRNCFGGKNNSKRLNIYVSENSTSLNTCLYNNTSSLVGTNITWTNNYNVNKCYYNTVYNIYIYPVNNVTPQ